MKIQQVQNNSICVLTNRNPRSLERERYIFAVFLVYDTYEGDNKEEGYVSTTLKYKLKQSPSEVEKMLFWNYHSNSNNPHKPVWSSGLHRYFHDDVVALVLRNRAEIKRELMIMNWKKSS